MIVTLYADSSYHKILPQIAGLTNRLTCGYMSTAQMVLLPTTLYKSVIDLSCFSYIKPIKTVSLQVQAFELRNNMLINHSYPYAVLISYMFVILFQFIPPSYSSW